MEALDPRFAETVEALHALAEHVLAAARYAATGRIGLRPVPGGIGTPAFGAPERTVAIVGGDIVVHANGRPLSAAPVTTIRHAASIAGIDPGAPGVYEAVTRPDFDGEIRLHPGAVAQAASWLQMVDEALARFAPSAERTLWPEHFDLAISTGNVNYGGALGDGYVAEPYLYVGPHDLSRVRPDGFWNQPFGASLEHRRVAGADDAVGFFEEGRRRLG